MSSEQYTALLGASPDGHELDDVPTVKRSGRGNWIWAEERCARRCGLRSDELGLFKTASAAVKLGTRFTAVPEFRCLNDDIEAQYSSTMRQVDMLKSGSKLRWVFLGRRQRLLITSRLLWLIRLKTIGRAIMDGFARFDELEHRRNIVTATGNSLSGDFQPKVGVGRGSVIQTPNRKPRSKSCDDGLGLRHTNVNADNTKFLARRRSLNNLQDLDLGDRAKFHRPVRRAAESFSTLSTAGSWPVRYTKKRPYSKPLEPMVLYVVVGWFPRKAHDPTEVLLSLGDKAQLFRKLRSAIRGLRGWRTFLSLKSVQGFGLYKCETSNGAHIEHNPTSAEMTTLSHLFRAYNTSSTDNVEETVAWADWIHKNLNDGKKLPFDGRYSLCLILKWSPLRLTIVVMLPLLLSFAVGMWYMIVRDDAGAAWTIASYIVTGGASIIALLAVLSGLKDT